MQHGSQLKGLRCAKASLTRSKTLVAVFGVVHLFHLLEGEVPAVEDLLLLMVNPPCLA